MSTFTNAHSAKDGDFFTYNKDGEIVYGKIINSKIGKSIVWTRTNNKPEVENYLNLENVQFYTNRKIASSYAMSILRANGYWNI